MFSVKMINNLIMKNDDKKLLKLMSQGLKVLQTAVTELSAFTL